MQIQVNTDHNIHGREALVTYITDELNRLLSRMSDRITRIEVHLTDENGGKSGVNDKRCVIEARIEGQKPVATTHQAGTLNYAIDGATNKLTRLIESTLGRQAAQKRRRANPIPPADKPE